MKKKEKLRLTEDINCKEMFFNEWNSYIMECKALTAGDNHYSNVVLIQQLSEIKYKMEAFAKSPDTAECISGTLDELVCILEKLKIDEVDQLLRGFDVHIKILTSLKDNEKNPKDKALMENTLFDIGVIFTELCRIFNVKIEG